MSKLRDWRLARKLTLKKMAEDLDLGGPRTYQRYEVGESQAPTEVIEDIVALTDGEITANDLHAACVAYLKAHSQNKPNGLRVRPVPNRVTEETHVDDA